MAALRAYAHAFAAGRYTAMWAWLTPFARAGWGGPAGFAAYYRAKFAPNLAMAVCRMASRLGRISPMG